MIEFTVAEGKVVGDGIFGFTEGRTYPVSIDPKDVSFVEGQSELWGDDKERWTRIVVRTKGVGSLYVKGSYQEVLEKLGGVTPCPQEGRSWP